MAQGRAEPLRGGFGWGKGVLVEDVRADGGSSPWLFPGPRARELAEALHAVQTSDHRPTNRGPS
ncbi:MAG: hypothetical protein M3N25_07480 [Actinomycetota bacterium]|nr:hypothetical protein [Actinomycetota bacterium]